MSERTIAFSSEGRFEIYCCRSSSTSYPEKPPETLKVCIPFKNASYSATKALETGNSPTYHIGAREVLVMPIDQLHGIKLESTADIVSIQFNKKFVSEALGEGELCVQQSFTTRDPFISLAAAQLRDLLPCDDRQNFAFIEALATAILYRIKINANVLPRVWSRELVQPLTVFQRGRIERLIEEQIDQPISLAMLAKQADLSMWHFMRRFNASHGMPPHEYLVQRRLTLAQTLLAQTKLSITEIALEVGMSHSHFSRSFLRHFGVSPREYRRLHIS